MEKKENRNVPLPCTSTIISRDKPIEFVLKKLYKPNITLYIEQNGYILIILNTVSLIGINRIFITIVRSPT